MKSVKEFYSAPVASVLILHTEYSLCVSTQGGTIKASSEQEDNNTWTNIF